MSGDIAKGKARYQNSKKAKSQLPKNIGKHDPYWQRQGKFNFLTFFLKD